MHLSRRQFFKVSAASAGASSLALMGFIPSIAHAEVRQYRLLRSVETRNNCTYCSVGCGILMYSLGDGAKNVEKSIFHIEGDPDHPVSRGSLCPKGAGLVDFIHSKQRLHYPEVREPGSHEWKRISWEEAYDRIAQYMKADRDAHFIHKNEKGVPVNRWETFGILAASASSNETGILTQKFARSLGVVGLDTQARVCHGPTVQALASTFGRGAMTNTWVDIKNADFILVMGGNAAEAHPVGFKWAIEAKKQKGAKLFVVDPRFNRTAAVADEYIPIRSGSDITFLGGIINWLIEHDKIQWQYVKAYTNATWLVHEEFNFEEGLFTGFDADKKQYDKTSWTYQLDANGIAKTDPSMQDSRCVFQLLKKHYSRYTVDMVNRVTGSPKDGFLKLCEELGKLSAIDKVGTILYALGWTQHTVGAQNIRTMAIIQLLLGNIGMPGGGVNALRGHSNIQGLSDQGLLSTSLPGYLVLPHEDKHPSLSAYLDTQTPKALDQNQLNYWSNTPKFMVSFLKWFYGDNANKENNFGYDWLPKWNKMFDCMQMIELMEQGRMNGMFVQGFNIMASLPDSNRVRKSLSKLKCLVVVDPIATETASFWQNQGEQNDVDSSAIQTEVFRLPSMCFAEENGSITNSSRWLQWHWTGAKPPKEAKADAEIMSEIFWRIHDAYQQEGGVNAEPILSTDWHFQNKYEPSPEELAMQDNGKALVDLYDAKTGALIVPRGEQLDSFAQLRDDGSTSCANWILSGSWTRHGNQMAKRDNTDSGLGNTPGWAWAWPVNRRILYNRASLSPEGQPWDSNRTLIFWDGKKWSGADVADFKADEAPGSGMNPFIMNEEGVGRLFAAQKMAEGPFSEHYEPMESPIGTNPFHPQVISSPTVRIFDSVKGTLGTAQDFPYVATTYRLTEHFQFWTKTVLLNAITQPEQFIEISEQLAQEKGIQAGDWVQVSSKRGLVKVKAVVTKRLKPLNIDGKTVHQVGLPLHGGWESTARKGFLINNLTPFVGESNTQTPEYKSFLVNIERA